MSSDREEVDATKNNYTAHTDVVQEDSSIGTKVGQGVSAAMKVVHGIGETIRGLAIDLADLGKGSGKTIAEDGKAETKEGVKQMESSIRR